MLHAAVKIGIDVECIVDTEYEKTFCIRKKGRIL